MCVGNKPNPVFLSLSMFPFFRHQHEELQALVEEKVRVVLGDQATRTYLEKTIHDLRQQLDKKESSSSSPSSPTWQQEMADLLAEIQRECNAAFQRGQARRKSPRNVVHHPSQTRTQNHANLPNDEILKDFFFNENWGTNDSTGDASIPLSLPALDESLNEIAESLNELGV